MRQRISEMLTPPPEWGLSAQQWRFVRAYVDDPDSQAAAAIAAGYAPQRAYATASRLVRSGKIQAAIRAVQADKAASDRLDGKYVRKKVTEILDQPPGASGGPPWREYVQALMLAARITGLIQPGERTTYIQSTSFSGVSTEELRRMLYGDVSAPSGQGALPAHSDDCPPEADM